MHPTQDAAVRAPIFIVGTERSGSNLLRLILDSHSEIAIPHPPHVLHYFAKLESSYGSLGDEHNLRALARDVLRLLDTHISPWPFRPDLGNVVRDARPRDLLGIFGAIYEHYRERAGKSRWGCKSTFMIHHVARIQAAWPRARFVWLVRDPRDVACSSLHSVFNPCHPVLTARLWRAQQQLGFELERDAPEAVHRLRYEDLVSGPQEAVASLSRFLEVKPEPAMLQFFQGEEARRLASLSLDWSQTASPIAATRTGRFRDELRTEQLAWIEREAGDTMRALGYELLTSADDCASEPPGEGRLAVHEAALRLRVELRSLLGSRNHWRRWRRAWLIRRVLLTRRWAGRP